MSPPKSKNFLELVELENEQKKITTVVSFPSTPKNFLLLESGEYPPTEVEVPTTSKKKIQKKFLPYPKNCQALPENFPSIFSDRFLNFTLLSLWVCTREIQHIAFDFFGASVFWGYTTPSISIFRRFYPPKSSK